MKKASGRVLKEAVAVLVAVLDGRGLRRYASASRCSGLELDPFAEGRKLFETGRAKIEGVTKDGMVQVVVTSLREHRALVGTNSADPVVKLEITPLGGGPMVEIVMRPDGKELANKVVYAALQAVTSAAMVPIPSSIASVAS